MFGATGLTTKPTLKKPVGTMRADEEAVKKISSPGVKQLVRTTKTMKIAESPSRFTVKVPVHGKLGKITTNATNLSWVDYFDSIHIKSSIKFIPCVTEFFITILASETVILPAKSRLGMSKQVTFNRTATVSHFEKPGVFSRLGV